MEITQASAQDREEIIRLLQASKLPAEDLPIVLHGFYIAKEEGRIIGLIGMEPYSSFGLLRSMVVDPDYRNRQVAGKLVQLLEEQALAGGVRAMYLLTETAEIYFGKKGYISISRDEVPAEVKASSEFSHVCPVSAVVMKKNLHE